MKNIVLFSPTLIKRKTQSGINSRILDVEKWFIKQGGQTQILDKVTNQILKKADIFYIMISSKKESISYKLVDKIPKSKTLIIDLYTPLLLEKRASIETYNIFHWINYFYMKRTIKTILYRGNHFLIVNNRQRKYWLKTSQELGVKIETSDISVIPSVAPAISRRSLTAENRKVILWFGGIYPWLDPKPLIHAFAKIAKRHPEWKLRFLGAFQPDTGYQNSYLSLMRIAENTIPAGQLEIVPWVHLNSLPQYLNDVSFAVHLPKNTEEDYYSHRVRILTLVKANVPVISSGNDAISDILVKVHAGDKVSIDILKLSTKLEHLINNKLLIQKWRKNTNKIEGKYVSTQLDANPLIRLLKNDKLF